MIDKIIDLDNRIEKWNDDVSGINEIVSDLIRSYRLVKHTNKRLQYCLENIAKGKTNELPPAKYAKNFLDDIKLK